MKKNGQYVGVDEKYIPEDEKYVDNTGNSEIKDSVNKGIISAKEYISDKDNQEKIKKAGKKGFKILKGIGIGYLVFVAFILIMVITIFVIVIINFTKMGNDMNKNKQNINDQIDNANNEYDKGLFNSTLEMYSGTQYGSSIGHLLDNAVSSLKKDTSHIINVIYGNIITSDTNEIVSLKKQFESSTRYEVSLNYDDNGYINEIEISNY